jgi:hypothetical protein
LDERLRLIRAAAKGLYSIKAIIEETTSNIITMDAMAMALRLAEV